MENGGNSKVKLMCSYGGKINPRPHDHKLSYVGGDTKILAVHRRSKFSDIITKLKSLSPTPTFAVKYQLPGEDLDALVSVINDEDLDNMMVEYDRIKTNPARPARLRLFLFPVTNSDIPDYLFGFDKETNYDDSKKPDPVQNQTRFEEEEKQTSPEVKEKVVEEAARENHVTVNGGYAVGPTVGHTVGPSMGQAVYLIPVTAGGSFPAVRYVYPDQPVYSYVAPVAATVAGKDGRTAT